MLRVELLGGLHISLKGEPVNGFISSKAQALFCYLVYHPQQTHLRSTLATLFWGDMSDEDAATNLRQAIANLKKLLEPYVEITRQTVAFKADQPYWSDVETWLATEDVALYRGGLLAGFNVADAPDFEDWLTTEREHLHETALKMLRKHAKQHSLAADYDAAIAALQRLLQLDALQEDAQRDLMRLLAINGQRSDALAQYQACVAALWDELGVEPELETRRLAQRIKTTQRIINLPSEMTAFIGRENEVAELTRRTADPTCHLMTIVGLGGIGKTRLALRVAHQHAQHFLNGAVMVNLTSVRSQESFLSALADALRFPLLQLGTPHTQLLDYLREKHMLIVLDNVEQIAHLISQFLSDLMQTAAEVKLIATSRQRLNLRGEWVLAVEGLPVHGQVAPAQALFLETARRVRGDDRTRHEPPEVIERICELVGGMPLAIELAAAWSRLLTCDELAAEIASNLTALEATSFDGEERHRSLRAVFDYSWQLFSAQEQRVLTALSSFVGGFTRAAAEKVAGASLALLLGLADKMLLRREAEGRFSLHEMLRQYLVEKLPDSPDFVRVRAAYTAYFVQFMHERGGRLKGAEQQTLLAEITRDRDNIHVAWENAVQHHESATLSALLPNLYLYHELKSNWRVAADLFSHSESGFDVADTPLYCTWLSYLALSSSRTDQPEQTHAYTSRCLAILPQDDPAYHESLARVWLALAYSQVLRGAFKEALGHALRALELRRTLSDDWGVAQCLMRVGTSYGQLAQYDFHSPQRDQVALDSNLRQARQAVEEGMAISQRLGEQFLTVRFQTLLATVCQLSGDIDGSYALHQASYAFYEKVNSLDGLCMALNGLGGCAHYRQDYPLATQYFQEALELARQIGARQWEANALVNIGINYAQTKQYRLSRDYYQQSQAVFRALGNQVYVDMIEKDLQELNELVTAQKA